MLLPGFDETENEIRYRLHDPDGFQQDTFRRIPLQQSGKKVFGVTGRRKGESTTTLQAYRFPKDAGWTIASARTWVEQHQS